MTQMKIKQVLRVIPHLPAKSSVLLRANHGVGKSSLVRQLASIIKETKGLESYPVIDRRLSLTQPGDLIGLPVQDGETTKWLPPDWYVMACKQPCVLFLDEINRAEAEVMQGGFQISLDHELNGHRLHPETRVFAAINLSHNYNVNQMDPALLDRFFVIDLHTTTEDWLEWARENGIASQIIDFISQNEKFLNPPSNNYDADSVQPTPRSWEFVSNAVGALLLAGQKEGSYDRDTIRLLSAGYVGNEVAIAFIESLKDSYHFTGEDIFNKWSEIKDKIEFTNLDVANMAVDKLAHASQSMTKLVKRKDGTEELVSTLTKAQGKNVEQFFWDLPIKELRPIAWQKMARGPVDERMVFLKSINDYIKHALLDVYGVPAGKAGIGILPNVPGLVVDKKEGY